MQLTFALRLGYPESEEAVRRRFDRPHGIERSTE